MKDMYCVAWTDEQRFDEYSKALIIACSGSKGSAAPGTMLDEGWARVAHGLAELHRTFYV